MLGYVITALMAAITVAAAILGFGPSQMVALQYVFYGLLVCWVIIGILFKGVLNVFPAKAQLMATSADQLNSDAFSIQAELSRVGFATISRPMLFNTGPPTAMLALRHPHGTCFATIYNPVIAPDKLGTDLVSVIRYEHGNGTKEAILTTGNMAEGGTVPVPEHSLMQLFPGADTRTLLQEHLRAIQFLKQNGMNILTVGSSQFRPVLFASMDRIRSTILRNPVWNTMVSLIRTFTKKSPYLGSITEQPAVVRSLQRARQRLASVSS